MSYFMRVDIVSYFSFDCFEYNEGLLKILKKIWIVQGSKSTLINILIFLGVVPAVIFRIN